MFFEIKKLFFKMSLFFKLKIDLMQINKTKNFGKTSLILFIRSSVPVYVTFDVHEFLNSLISEVFR